MFNYTIELLAFWDNNIKLCHSCQYCGCLTYSESIVSFMPPEISKICDFRMFQRRIKNQQWTQIFDLILVVYKNSNVLQSFCFETFDSDNKPIYLRFGIFNSVFSILNWCFAFFNPQLRHKLVDEKCTCLLLWRIRFIYSFPRMTLICHTFYKHVILCDFMSN